MIQNSTTDRRLSLAIPIVLLMALGGISQSTIAGDPLAAALQAILCSLFLLSMLAIGFRPDCEDEGDEELYLALVPAGDSKRPVFQVAETEQEMPVVFRRATAERVLSSASARTMKESQKISA